MAEQKSDVEATEEQARYRLFRERPGIGLLLFLTTLGFPLLVSFCLLKFASAFFLADLTGKLLFTGLVALSLGASLWTTSAIRARLIRDS